MMTGVEKDLKIGVVIPTFNGRAGLERILAQLEAQTCRDWAEVVVVVVVDGSTDGTLALLETRFPDVHVIRGEGTWWYTKSMNKGFQYLDEIAAADYAVTLNDDCEIEEVFIETLLLAGKKVGEDCIMGSISFTREKPHRVFFSGTKRIDWKLCKAEVYHKFLLPCDPDELQGIRPSVVLPGRGMLIPMKVLRGLDYFDEAFPQYGSDDDFCLRALKRGIRSYVSWDSRVYMRAQRTGRGTSFVRQSFLTFLKSFFYKYSKTYVKKDLFKLWRHGDRFFLPISYLILLRIRFTDYLFGPKVG